MSALILLTLTPPNSTELLTPMLCFDPMGGTSTLGPTFRGPLFVPLLQLLPTPGRKMSMGPRGMSTQSLSVPPNPIYLAHTQEYLGPQPLT